ARTGRALRPVGPGRGQGGRRLVEPAVRPGAQPGRRGPRTGGSRGRFVGSVKWLGTSLDAHGLSAFLRRAASAYQASIPPAPASPPPPSPAPPRTWTPPRSTCCGPRTTSSPAGEADLPVGPATQNP